MQQAASSGPRSQPLALVAVGAALVVLSTFVAWDLYLSTTGGSYGPALDLEYWRGLSVSYLRTFSWYDVTLYLADVTVTCLAAIGGLLALAGLVTRRFAARLVLGFGVAATGVFAVEGVRWMIGVQALVMGLGLSIAGAVLVVVGAGSCWRPSGR